MNNLQAATSNSYPPIFFPSAQRTIPHEIFTRISFFLDEASIEAALRVSRAWRTAVVEATKSNEIESVKIFMRHFSLDSCVDFSCSQRIRNLGAFKKLFDPLKMKINVKVQDKTLLKKFLQYDNHPVVLKPLYEIKLIEQAKSSPMGLYDLVKEMVSKNRFIKAQRFVKEISDPEISHLAINTIIEALLLKKKYKQAIDVVFMLPKEEDKITRLEQIACALNQTLIFTLIHRLQPIRITSFHLFIIIEKVLSNPSKSRWKSILKDLVEHEIHSEQRNLDNAFALIKLMESHSQKEYLISLASYVAHIHDKFFFYHKIVKQLLAINAFNAASDLAKAIPEEMIFNRSFVFKELAYYVLCLSLHSNIDRMNKALDFLLLIPIKELKYNALKEISEYCEKKAFGNMKTLLWHRKKFFLSIMLNFNQFREVGYFQIES